MSQTNTGIPLTHHLDGQGYRLIELPAELAALLEGENPPILHLTNAPNAALLKSPSQTYSLRQRNTSNALMLLAPSKPSTNTTSPDSDAPPSSDSLAILATLHDTVELHPFTEDGDGGGGSVARGKWHAKFAKSR